MLRSTKPWALLVALVGACLVASCKKELKCPDGAVLIPAGSFEMGTHEKVWVVWQLKPRKVTLTKPYCMDRTEVTQRAYELCEQTGGCDRPPGRLPIAPQGYKEPRHLVGWKQASEYCAWKGGRLPTEAEWEFAARGTDGRLFPWGNEPPTAEHWQWTTEATPDRLSEVGSYPKARSFFGLDDMGGNVAEWVSDRCGIHEPTPDVDPVGPDILENEECYLVRGAAWSAGWEIWAAATFRSFGGTGGTSQIGFRCAYEPR